MNKTILVWLLSTIFPATVPLGMAQQATKTPRLGYLTNAPLSTSSTNRNIFRQGLRE